VASEEFVPVNIEELIQNHRNKVSKAPSSSSSKGQYATSPFKPNITTPTPQNTPLLSSASLPASSSPKVTQNAPTKNTSAPVHKEEPKVQPKKSTPTSSPYNAPVTNRQPANQTTKPTGAVPSFFKRIFLFFAKSHFM
jgi:hypothetical protein